MTYRCKKPWSQKSPDPWLYKDIVTGCLRIAYQSVFTDANNFTTYGMNRDPYTGFFGFTKEETQKLLEDSGLSDKVDKVREWYDGYRFGKEHVYCPWSLVNYCDEAKNDRNIEPEAFWVNTSGNDTINLYIKNSMEAHDAENIEKLQALLDGKSVEIALREFTTYPDLSHNIDFDTFMTLMLHTGYVTYSEDSGYKDQIKIRIPNREVYECFKAKQKLLFGRDNPYWFKQPLNFVDLLMENKVEEAEPLLSDMLKQFLSVRNTASEFYYHGFMTSVLGFASAARDIVCVDETESGDGYPDVVLKKSTKTVVVLEFKKAQNTPKGLMAGADLALSQILEKRYAVPYIEDGYQVVYGIGISFGGKNCMLKSLGNLVKPE